MAQMTPHSFQAARTSSFSFRGGAGSACGFPHFQSRRKSGRGRPGGLGRRNQEAHHRTGFGQGKNRSLVRSSQSQFGEAASRPLGLWSFTRKLPPNMTRRLIGIFSAARTQRSSSMQNLSVRLLRLRKLLSAWASGPHHTRRFLLRKFPFLLIYRERAGGNLQIVAVAHTSRKPGYWKERI
jgi:hypothetical protein